MPAPHVRGDQRAVGRAVSAHTAPFVAWMATQALDEPTRRRHREVVEAYLLWRYLDDDGVAAGRRRRYEQHVDRTTPEQLPATREGLDQFARYRELVARTLPIDR